MLQQKSDISFEFHESRFEITGSDAGQQFLDDVKLNDSGAR